MNIILIIKPNLNILKDYKNDYSCFNIACENNHMQVIKWLVKVKPNNYKLLIGYLLNKFIQKDINVFNSMITILSKNLL